MIPSTQVGIAFIAAIMLIASVALPLASSGNPQAVIKKSEVVAESSRTELFKSSLACLSTYRHDPLRWRYSDVQEQPSPGNAEQLERKWELPDCSLNELSCPYMFLSQFDSGGIQTYRGYDANNQFAIGIDWLIQKIWMSLAPDIGRVICLSDDLLDLKQA